MDVLQWSRSGRVARGELESDLTVELGTTFGTQKLFSKKYTHA